MLRIMLKLCSPSTWTILPCWHCGLRIKLPQSYFVPSNAGPAWINARLLQSIPAMEEALAEGAIVIVEDDRMRIRKFSAEF